jgi:hypothetical protein
LWAEPRIAMVGGNGHRVLLVRASAIVWGGPRRVRPLRLSQCTGVASATWAIRCARRPALARRPYSGATVPDAPQLRLAALPSGPWAPWLSASKRTGQAPTQGLACGTQTTAGSHPQRARAVTEQTPPLPRPAGSGLRRCRTLSPGSGRPSWAH